MDRATFFAIMGAFPTGVCIVTTIDASQQPRGLTSNALCSVSAEPPLLLVCVDKNSNTLPGLRHSQKFVVNYLSAGRGDLANLFASKEPDKFARISWRPARNGMPWLQADSIAYAECTITQEITGGVMADPRTAAAMNVPSAAPRCSSGTTCVSPIEPTG